MALTEISYFKKHVEHKDHVAVVFLCDIETGLRGFIAIHNNMLGPAVGGTRLRYYKDENEALTDALRLSRAMTYKCAMGSVPFGGGKAVLMAPKNITQSQKRALLIAYANRLNLLGGHFFTGEDVGIDESDIALLSQHSDFIIGRPKIGGMPARYAAISVCISIEASLGEKFGNETFVGRSFAVKGLGNVGKELCALISAKGGTLVVADIDPKRTSAARTLFPDIRIVPHTRIHMQKVDVFVPCALGDEFNQKTIPELGCAIVCGSANNQLSTAKDGARLHKRKILYVPDYVANAGGLINVVDELHEGGYSEPRVTDHIQHIKVTVKEILAQSRISNIPTNEIADAIAEKRFKKTNNRTK